SQFGLFMLRQAKLQAAMMLLAAAVTAITQYAVFRIYGPLLWHLPVDFVRSKKENAVDLNAWKNCTFTTNPIWAPASETTCQYLLRKYNIYVAQEGLQYDVDSAGPISGPPKKAELAINFAA
ncbi:hypothetical protein F66182_16753, partial [Fusarium sp. NRRL 66182]